MKLEVKGKTESKRFENALKSILSVSHGEIKKCLDEEKAAKRRKKSKKSSASGREANGRA